MKSSQNLYKLVAELVLSNYNSLSQTGALPTVETPKGLLEGVPTLVYLSSHLVFTFWLCLQRLPQNSKSINVVYNVGLLRYN